MVNTMAVKNFIRMGDFFKIISAMEMGAESGMWTFARYQTWLENKKTWYFPAADDKPDTEPAQGAQITVAPPQGLKVKSEQPAAPVAPTPASPSREKRAIEIEPVEGGLESLIKKLGND
jgi:hypothetical protein